MKYLLILDTFAHSHMNTYYFRPFPTIKAAKECLLRLLIDGKITMKYEGEPIHKIYCAFIAAEGKEWRWYQRILRTDDGVKWYKDQPNYTDMDINEMLPISEIDVKEVA